MLFSYAGLHAKTIVLDQTAFVCSANLSDASIKLLVEAAVRTDNPNVVFKAISFIQELTIRVSGGSDPTGDAAILAAPTQSYLYGDHAWKEACRAGRRSQGAGAHPLTNPEVSSQAQIHIEPAWTSEIAIAGRGVANPIHVGHDGPVWSRGFRGSGYYWAPIHPISQG
jgi:phosphatidylserine/phosphatidylglycerophosphate/cardiolipin synthase-like enzyme